MTTFQRLTHDINIPDTFKRIINPTFRQITNSLNDVINLSRVNKIRHTKFLRKFNLARVNINPNNTTCTNHTRTLNNIQTNPAKAKNRNRRLWLDFRVKHNCANTRSHAAPNVTNFIKRRIFANLSNSNIRQNRKIRKRRTPHIMKNRLTI